METLRRTCSAKDRPTAIVVGVDQLAELVYLLLHRLGVRLPEDISVVSVGNVHRDRPIKRQLAAVTVDEAEISRQAVDLLHQMQYGSRAIEDNERILMPVSFYEGETLGPAPKPLQQQDQK